MRKSKDYLINKQILNDRKTKCVICGLTDKCCLEFHHIKDKQYSISQAVSHLRQENFIKELDKCICVCANCHKKIHNNEINLNNNEKIT